MNIQSSFTVYTAALHALILNPLLLAYFWLGLSWIDSIDSISANKRFSSSKTSSRKPYSNSKQQEKQKHSAENTINVSLVAPGVVFWWCCPCLAAWLAAPWFGVVWLGAPLPCVVFCGAALSCGGELLCSAVCLRRCLCLLFVSCSRAVRCVCPGVLPCGWSAPCGALLPCVVSCGAVLSCRVVLSCSGVFLRCCVCLLLLFSFQTAANPVNISFPPFFFENKTKLYTMQPTREQQDHILLTDLRVTRRPPWRRC